MHHIRGRLAAIAICIAALASAQSQPQTAKDFLRKYLAFSDADVAALDKGELVTKLPKVTDQREVTAFAAVRVNARPEQLAMQFRDIVRWKKGDSVPEIGKFSDTPLIADLSGLNIEPEDIKLLKKCKPGSCDIKLSAASMDQLVKGTNWTAENYQLPYAAGIPGELRVIFIPTRWDPPKVKNLETGVSYRAFFFSCASGKEIDLGKVTGDPNGDWQIPTAPVFQDWVVVMEKEKGA